MIPIKGENPTEHFPLITILLIALNVIIFIFQISIGPEGMKELVYKFSVIPVQLYKGSGTFRYFTLMTSIFFHASFLHLAGNMLYLWIFGNNIEDTMGKTKFLIFFLTCGIIGSLGHAMLNPNSQIPTIGASGAISGILAAYLLLYPKVKIITIVPIFFFIKVIKLPAFFFLGFWIFLQLLYGIPTLTYKSAHGGVAWFGHIGGFLAGFILLPVFISSLPFSKSKKVSDEDGGN